MPWSGSAHAAGPCETSCSTVHSRAARPTQQLNCEVVPRFVINEIIAVNMKAALP